MTEFKSPNGTLAGDQERLNAALRELGHVIKRAIAADAEHVKRFAHALTKAMKT